MKQICITLNKPKQETKQIILKCFYSVISLKEVVYPQRGTRNWILESKITETYICLWTKVKESFIRTRLSSTQLEIFLKSSAIFDINFFLPLSNTLLIIFAYFLPCNLFCRAPYWRLVSGFFPYFTFQNSFGIRN